MRSIVIAATAVALSNTSVLSAEMDGLWHAGVQNGFSTSYIDMTIVDKMFSVRFSGQLKKNLEGCEFVGFLSEAGSEALLKGNNSSNGCERAPKIKVARTGPNTLRVSFSGDRTKPFDVEVSGIAKKTYPAEMPAYPENFDTLGVLPGMTITKIREAVKAEQMAEVDASSDTVSLQSADGNDQLVAVFETENGNPNDEVPAIAIFRSFRTAENKRLTLDEMDKALFAKYGKPTLIDGSQRQWYFDNKGALLSTDDTTKGNWGCVGRSAKQTKYVDAKTVRLQMSFIAGCGVRLFASYDTDADNRVAGVQIQMLDNALALNASWDRQKQGLGQTITDAINGLKSVREAPKL